jgi:prephenate dehydratase
MRVAYLGPEGTFTQEALIASVGEADLNLVPLATIHDAVMAVQDGSVDRALVPIENSLEGSVNATLDALAIEADDVTIVGEVIHPIRQCLIARTEIGLSQIEVVVSYPHASAQCARFLRRHLPDAELLAGSSTAEAVRTVAASERPWAALGNRLAAQRYGCRVLRAGVEDVAGNQTRFVWLGPIGAPAGGPGGESAPAGGESGAPGGESGAPAAGSEPRGLWKTAIVFWGAGSEAPGWLVACLSEFADRGVNLTRIESRPLKQGLGRYMFFVDLDGRDLEPQVLDALAGLGTHAETLRVLGSFPVA